MIRPCNVAAALMLTLCACTSAPSDKNRTWVHYACSDGQTLQAAYPDARIALIKLKGDTHVLHIAVSGSGARYIGEGWQWWTKGMHDGRLAPLAAGEAIAGAPAIACHAN